MKREKTDDKFNDKSDDKYNDKLDEETVDDKIDELDDDDKESDDELEDDETVEDEIEEMKHRHNYMNYKYSYTNNLNYINYQILLELRQINEYMKREREEKERDEMIVIETLKAQQNSEERTYRNHFE